MKEGNGWRIPTPSCFATLEISTVDELDPRGLSKILRSNERGATVSLMLADYSQDPSFYNRASHLGIRSPNLISLLTKYFTKASIDLSEESLETLNLLLLLCVRSVCRTMKQGTRLFDYAHGCFRGGLFCLDSIDQRTFHLTEMQFFTQQSRPITVSIANDFLETGLLNSLFSACRWGC